MFSLVIAVLHVLATGPPSFHRNFRSEGAFGDHGEEVRFREPRVAIIPICTDTDREHLCMGGTEE